MPRVALMGGVSARAFGFAGVSVEAEVLLAGGGGGGGASVSGSVGQGGAGGAGRFIQDFVRLAIGSYEIVVGAGAPMRPAGGNNGLNGGDTSAFGIVMPGGGGGGTPNSNGRPGGSGGGGGSTDSGGSTLPGLNVPGTGKAGQGHDGGQGAFGGLRGLGGGALTAGTFLDPGAGVVSNITGVEVEYCRGGDTAPSTSPGSGGVTSSGGGTATGAPGVDGIAIVKYPGLPRGTGGVITQLPGFTIHTFGAGAHVLDLVR